MHVSRINYYRSYLDELERAISDGLDIRGYMAWSLLDNFEWADGFRYRFGLHYVDYQTPERRRYAKDSAHWYADHISARASYSKIPVHGNHSDSDSDSDIGSDSGHPFIVQWHKSESKAVEVRAADGEVSATYADKSATRVSLLGSYVSIYQALVDSALQHTSVTTGNELLAASGQNKKNEKNNNVDLDEVATPAQPSLLSYVSRAFQLAFLVPAPIVV